MFVDFLFSICLLVVFSCSRLAFEYTWDCETGYSARSGLMTARDAKMSHDTGKQWACICMNPSGVGFGEWHILTATKSSWKCIASLTNKTIWRNSTIKFTKSYRSCLWYPNQCQSSDFLGLLSWITFWESSSFVAFDLHLNLLDLISSCPSSLMHWDWEFMKLQPMKVWFIRINKDREFTRS